MLFVLFDLRDTPYRKVGQTKGLSVKSGKQKSYGRPGGGSPIRFFNLILFYQIAKGEYANYFLLF